MSLSLYMDVHVRRAVTEGLRLREIDVITAQEDQASEFKDPDFLNRATVLGRVLITQDEDLLSEAEHRQRSEQSFAGLIYAHQLNIGIGEFIADLELIAHASEPAEWVNRVEYLPLK